MAGNRCPNCGTTTPPMFNPETGEYVCPVCGYIYGPVAEPLKPRSQEEYLRKVHSERMPKNPDTTPRAISIKHLLGSRELSRESSKNREYSSYLSQVQREFNIPGYVTTEVERLFEEIRKAGGLKGRSHKLIIATLLFYVLKRYPNVALTQDQLERIAGADVRKVYRTYRVLVKEGYIQPAKTRAVRKPSEHLPSILSRLRIESQRSGKRENLLSDIPMHVLAKTADSLAEILQGVKPSGVAGATVYLFIKMLGFKLSQDIVAKSANVSTLTIRRVLKQITEETELTVGI
ncbi:transcription initiation factor IIB family protein [Infirmifilum sp. SLHALR2]